MKENQTTTIQEEMPAACQSEEFKVFDALVHGLLCQMKELMGQGRYGCNVLVAATTCLDAATHYHQGYLCAVGEEATLKCSLANILKDDPQLRGILREALAASERMAELSTVR